MSIVWNSHGNEQPYSSQRNQPDPLNGHNERIRAFRSTHDKLERRSPGAGDSLKIRLNLIIPIYGIVVLPKNSQN